MSTTPFGTCRTIVRNLATQQGFRWIEGSMLDDVIRNRQLVDCPNLRFYHLLGFILRCMPGSSLVCTQKHLKLLFQILLESLHA